MEATQKVVLWANRALDSKTKAGHMAMKARELPVMPISTLNAGKITLEQAEAFKKRLREEEPSSST